jgi:vancomycin permeability regulator SanA
MIRFRRVFLYAGLSFVLLALIAVGLLILDGLRDDIRKADVALVLGSKVEPDGQPSARLKARLDRASGLFRQHLVDIIIVSGATGKEGFNEAKVMAFYLTKNGVPAKSIIIDSQGITTEASAVNTADILQKRGLKSVIVVSQYFHISRSKLALRKAGVENVYSVHAHIFELRDLYSIPRELVGYVSYFFRKFDPPMQSVDR